jgi:hypothetical protein
VFQHVLLLVVASCAQPELIYAVAVASIPTGEARIWIYRDYQPCESLNMAAVTIAWHRAFANYILGRCCGVVCRIVGARHS